MLFTTINPTTEEILAEYQEISAEEINRSIHRCHKAFLDWRQRPIAFRAELMHKASDVLLARKEEFARLMALEMGKPYAQGIAEVEKSALCCRYFADNSERLLIDEPAEAGFRKSYVTFQPLGVLLAIMPWNFPFWQVFRFACPNLTAGNTALLKHARNSMGCAIAIESVFREAGFPEDVFINLIIGQEPEGHLAEPVAQVIAHPLVKAVTLTGSTKVGSYVAEAAGRAIKKSVLELGGSDPYVILKDADLAKAAESCAFARLLNSGQSCIAAKRFIVERPVLEEFTRLFIDRMQTRIVGNPLDANNTVGPMARRDLRDSLHRQVSASVAMGARLIIGGEIPDGKGFFYPVTALADVRKGMPAFDEELFGPAAAIIAADNEAEALRLAADTIYGLGAAIYTSDIEKGERIAREGLFAGACFVNDFVRSDPRLPFGGINQSGYGRELALYSMREFVNIKTVCVA